MKKKIWNSLDVKQGTPCSEERIIDILRNGGVGVLSSDTLPGLMASVHYPRAVRRVDMLKRRSLGKPYIILISHLRDLGLFGCHPDNVSKAVLTRLWPGPVSVIVKVESRKWPHLRASQGTLAFRVPREKWLRRILRKTGPLVAPSANPEESAFSKTYDEAKRYFSNSVDFYYVLDEPISEYPSSLLSLKKDGIVVIREGAVKMEDICTSVKSLPVVCKKE